MKNKLSKVAVIFGITGQDGSHLAELLLEKNYIVYGLIRRSSSFNTGRLENIFDKLELQYGDITDIGSVMSIIKNANARCESPVIEIYNLAAMSHVRVSFDMEKYCADVDAIGVLNVLQSIKTLGLENRVKLYQASTSELYGNTLNSEKLTILDEKSPMNPVSPYAISKLYAFHLIKYYRDAYNMFCVNGILFNHTGERRGDTFVCKKITNYVKKFSELRENQEKNKPLQLGNIKTTRDFGYAKDYVFGMYLMLQNNTAEDFVLSTGRRVTIREFVELAFQCINIVVYWKGENENEKGYYLNESGEEICLIEVNPKYYRPLELTDLIGDSSKAREILNWKESVTLEELIKLMVIAE